MDGLFSAVELGTAAAAAPGFRMTRPEVLNWGCLLYTSRCV